MVRRVYGYRGMGCFSDLSGMPGAGGATATAGSGAGQTGAAAPLRRGTTAGTGAIRGDGGRPVGRPTGSGGVTISGGTKGSTGGSSATGGTTASGGSTGSGGTSGSGGNKRWRRPCHRWNRGQQCLPGGYLRPCLASQGTDVDRQSRGRTILAAYVVGKTVYLAATGIATKSSTNLTTWTSWPAGGGAHAGAWAPDISNFNGMFHLYYAVSSFGSNKSCIGQATRAALDTGTWTDKGNVLCSNMGTMDNWNAIDPNIIVDDDGVPWMDFGSFWGGIKLAKLNIDGTRADMEVHPRRAAQGGAVEGPFIFKRCGFYYLFVSFGSCCSAPTTTPSGWAGPRRVMGPYMDKAGVAMTSGRRNCCRQREIPAGALPDTMRSSPTTTALTTSITRSPHPPARTETPRCASPKSHGTRTAGRYRADLSCKRRSVARRSPRRPAVAPSPRRLECAGRPTNHRYFPPATTVSRYRSPRIHCSSIPPA